MATKSEHLLSAWSAFFVAHALAVQKIESELSRHAPLSMHEYDTLLTISRSPEQRLRYSELTAKSVYTKSGITRITKRLETRNYIARVRCERDKRGAYAELTHEGKCALKDTWEHYSRAILEIFDPALTSDDAKTLTQTMEKLLDQLEQKPLIQIGESSGKKS